MPEEFKVLMINPRLCTDCETCMSICSFVHDNKFIPLNKRIIGIRKRVELEWVISCDLCEGAIQEYLSGSKIGKSQCISACPNNAIFLGTINPEGNESRAEAINRIFN